MATATLIPAPRFTVFDANGNPVSGGLVHTYIPATTTPKATWQDAAETIQNQNPIPLDSAGSCLLYGAGTYQLTVVDANGVAIPGYSGVTSDTLAAVTAETARAVAAEALLAPKLNPPPFNLLQVGSLATLNSGSAAFVVESHISAVTPAAIFFNGTNAAFAVAAVVRNDRTDGVGISFRFGAAEIGTIQNDGAVIHYNTTSDYRLKTTFGHVRELAGTLIDAVPVHRAVFNVDPWKPRPMFLAHELAGACPWAVTGEKDAEAYQQVDHGSLVAVLWAEVRALRVRVAALEAA
jgi:hypothetical protein